MDTEANQNQNLLTIENDEVSLLRDLAKDTKRQLRYARVTSIASILMLIVVAVSLVIVIPKVIVTVNNLNTIIADASVTLETAETAIAGITETAESMDTFIADNSESISSVMTDIDAIDFEGLNQAITDLGDVVEPLANFFGKFQ